MSFRDELVKKVHSTRELIRQTAVNDFVGILKSSMIKCAEEGKISGSINLDIETECDENFYELFEIQGVLVDDKRRYSYIWLIEEVKKTDIFAEDIFAEIEMKLDSDDNILEFHWCL